MNRKQSKHERRNTMFPGRANYVGPRTGAFGLLHHDQLYETSHDVMERVAYVKREKPENEIATRLHNMIYLGDCSAIAKRAPLYTDYQAKFAPLEAKIMAYIKLYISDCAWNGKELVFTRAEGK